MNKTLEKFGYPKNLVKEFDYWYLLLRPEQVTLGSLILITKNNEIRLSNISENGFQEFPIIIKNIEDTLSSIFEYDKINYLMYMMVDPEVHFHIIPRYSDKITYHSTEFFDFGWPSMPNLNKINNVSLFIKNIIINKLKNKFDNG